MQLFRLAQETAIPYPRENEFKSMETELSATSKAVITKLPVPKDARITLLNADNPFPAGTNRARNFDIIAGCSNVPEALELLRALEKSPGGKYDIQLAISRGAITLS